MNFIEAVRILEKNAKFFFKFYIQNFQRSLPIIVWVKQSGYVIAQIVQAEPRLFFCLVQSRFGFAYKLLQNKTS